MDRDRGEVMRIGEIFRAKVVDVSKETITLEVTGDQEKIGAILELLRPMGIMEIARTGQVGLSRGRGRLQNGVGSSAQGRSQMRIPKVHGRGLPRPISSRKGQTAGEPLVGPGEMD